MNKRPYAPVFAGKGLSVSVHTGSQTEKYYAPWARKYSCAQTPYPFVEIQHVSFLFIPKAILKYFYNVLTNKNLTVMKNQNVKKALSVLVCGFMMSAFTLIPLHQARAGERTMSEPKNKSGKVKVPDSVKQKTDLRAKTDFTEGLFERTRGL